MLATSGVEVDMLEKQPYVGLRPFEPSDQAYFCGREHALDELANRIEQSRVVILFGPPGSGKTSLIQAGLIPKLTGPGLAWRVVAVRLFGQTEGLQSLIAWDPISGDQGNLVNLLRSQYATQHRSLVIVDQLEELFALVLSQDDFFCSYGQPKSPQIWDLRQKLYTTK
jgi:energy-coupling factor transporter ATP-binding protein EcfA2